MNLRPTSIRAKAVLGSAAAIGIVGAVLGATSAVVVTRLANDSLHEVLTTQVRDVRVQIEDVDESNVANIDLTSVDTTNKIYVQVVDTSGHIVVQSPGMSPSMILCTSPLPQGRSYDTVELSNGTSTVTYLREMETTVHNSDTYGICAAISTQAVEDLQQKIFLAMLIVLPLVTFGVGIAVWLAINRALGSVEDLRRQAAKITDTRNGELQVRPTGDEIEQLGRTLNDLLHRLEDQTELTRQFIADAGHELRNPLATLRVVLEFGLPDDQAGFDLALGELDRLEELVQDLLALARADSQSMPIRERVALDELVEYSVLGIKHQKPQLAVNVNLTPATVLGDGRALRSVVDNLIANAARHAATTITITTALEQTASTHTTPRFVMIQVDDDGYGLSPADCARVFERFVRLDEARDRDDGGSGLGLAIAAAVVESHGGTLVALPGPGGHFVARLPLEEPMSHRGDKAHA